MTPNAGRGVARLLLAAAILGGTALEAAAQLTGVNGAQGLPSPAVFGGARREQPGTNHVSLSTSIFGGYDTNILLDNLGGIGGGPSGSSEVTESSLAGGNALLEWSQTRTRVSYYGSVNADYRKFFDVDDFDLVSGGASAGVSYQMTPRQRLGFNGQGGVQPFYQFGVVGGAVPGFDGDVPLALTPDPLAARELVARYAAAADYSYDLSQRLNFIALVSRTGFEPVNDAASDARLRGLGGTSASAVLRYGITERVGVHGGYGYTKFANYAPALGDDGLPELNDYATHNVDVGIDYSDSLTLAPKLTFDFGTGTALTTNSGGVGSVNQGTSFNVVGFASLQKQFLRTWAASINYNRSVAYIEISNSVGVYDAASASIGGLFTDRLDGSASVSYVHGSPFSQGAAPLSSLTAGAQMRYAISRNAAAYVSYTFGYFDQAYRSTLIPSSPLNFSPTRHGVRVGVTFWFDLLH